MSESSSVESKLAFLRPSYASSSLDASEVLSEDYSFSFMAFLAMAGNFELRFFFVP